MASSRDDSPLSPGAGGPPPATPPAEHQPVISDVLALHDPGEPARRGWVPFVGANHDATISWRDVVASVGRDLVRIAAARDGGAAASLHAPRNLDVARRVVDRRLSSLFALSADNTRRNSDVWRQPVVGVLSSLFPAADPALLLARQGGDDTDSTPADPLGAVADAIRLFSGLRQQFGADSLLERIGRTADACAWLSHVVDALIDLVRIQETQLALRVPHPPAALAALPLTATARIQAAEALAARRADQVRAARRASAELRERLHEAEADEEEAVQRCRDMRELLREQSESLEAAERAADAHARCADRLEALRVELSELEDELAGTPGLTHLLTPAQARHVYSFLWQRGYGQGDEELWAELPLTDLLATRPWDAMWTGRTRHVFLFDPTQLDDAQVAWMEDVLKFIYQYRRHIWQRNHWFPLSRQPQSGAPMTTMYTARMSADRELTAAFAALCAAAPPGVSTSLFWCEPAFWCLPVKQCSWVVGDLSTPLANQLRELDLLEPVRVGWASAPGRFVEALIREQLALLDSHQDQCWELPAPWNDPTYTPPGLKTSSSSLELPFTSAHFLENQFAPP
ncbi:hypothetical protein ATCC90586_006772 [Pythium insidiosum]|nr:hypothetical protein ATCC90586_006772 [Pythium insidiosum]